MQRYSTVTIVFALLVLASYCVDVGQARSRSNHDEVTIRQFLYYLDVMKGIKLDNMLVMSRNFASQLLDSIPLDQRGNSAFMLVDYIDGANKALLEPSFASKESILMKLHALIGFFKEEMVKHEEEDIIIRQGLMGTFEFLARLSIEDRKFHEKFVKGSQLLRQKVSAESIARFPEFFDVLRDIEVEENIVEREVLMRRYEENVKYVLAQLRL